MIGYFDYTTYLTYLSPVLSLFAVFLAFTGERHPAFLLLIGCGILDMFDGRIARSKKNRTEDEKAYGIQIDSLCDLISFGVAPALIGFAIRGTWELHWDIIFLLLFPVCGLIRLAYYNVEEAKRQKETEENRKYFTGLPITSSSIILPSLYILYRALVSFGVTIPDAYFSAAYVVAIAITGLLYVTKCKVRKPGKIGFIVLCMLGILALVAYILLWP